MTSPLRPLIALALALCATAAGAQDLPRGVIIDDVKCAGDPTQSYSLYLPAAYSPDRQWNLLIAFHPGARGRAMVEKYYAAAEQYGYIVAGSNASRNGSWAISNAAIKAMSADLSRFAINPQRIYLTGMSGGARVAMEVALANSTIAGVVASSAGFPDGKPRGKVSFAVFGTAGTDDFNYTEMRQLDRKLTTPHRVVIFSGGHTLPPDAIALEAIEWMELQAMKAGRRTRDEALIDKLLEKRRQAVAAAPMPSESVHLLESLVADFTGLRDVAADAGRAADLAKQSDIKKALSRERAAEDAEARTITEIMELEATLGDESRRNTSLMALRDRLSQLSKKASADTESPDRSLARRVLRTITAGAGERVQDREYRALLEQYGWRGGERGR